MHKIIRVRATQAGGIDITSVTGDTARRTSRLGNGMRDLLPALSSEESKTAQRATPGGLSAAEQQLWQGFHSGQELALGDGDARDGASWGADRTIRAEIVADLLAGSGNRTKAPRAALRLTGAKVTGVLDLHHLDVGAPILLLGCWFSDVPLLAQARTATLVLGNCLLPGLSARQLEVRGDVDFSHSTVDGEIILQDARIGGVLSLNGARLSNKDSCVLDADGLTVSGGLTADDRFSATGEVRLRGATIGRQLSLTGARIINRTGYALNADNLTVTGSVFADGRFTATGETRLPGATIDGQLNLNGARLTNKNGYALNAPYLTVTGGLFANDGFTATGETSLLGARIGGQLGFSGARLRNGGGCALNAERLDVAGDLFADKGFTATGETRLTGATIGGQALFVDATLTNEGGDVLCLAGARVGELWMVFAEPPDGMVRLAGTGTRLLADSPGTWPPTLRLDGCTYQELEGRELSDGGKPPGNVRVSVRQRLGWLRRDPRYSPQPYEQLANHYRRTGNESAARRVLLANHRGRRRGLPLSGRLTGYLLDLLVGYGYRPWLAGWWFAACWLAGAVALRLDPPSPLTAAAPSSYSPATHAIDLMLPVVNLGYDNAWQATDITTGLGVAGWLLIITAAGGIIRLLTRD